MSGAHNFEQAAQTSLADKGVRHSIVIPLTEFVTSDTVPIASGTTADKVELGAVATNLVGIVWDATSTGETNDKLIWPGTLPGSLNVRRENGGIKIVLKLIARVRDLSTGTGAPTSLTMNANAYWLAIGATALQTLAADVTAAIGAASGVPFVDSAVNGFQVWTFDLGAAATAAQLTEFVAQLAGNSYPIPFQFSVALSAAPGTNLSVDLIGAVLEINEHESLRVLADRP